MSADTQAGTLLSREPATGERLGEVALTDPARLKVAVSAAEEALRGDWSRDSVLRSRAMLAWAEAIEREATDLAELIMRETGKVRAEAHREVAMTADALRFNAGIARQVGGMAGMLPDGSEAHVVREPVGVTGFIVPWNWPVFLLMRDLGPAFAAGVTAVVKPSPETPLSVLRVVEIARGAGLPAGVLDIVFGGAEVGRALVEHPAVRAVAFTGSTAVGRAVMSSAAKDFTRVLLELGGKGTSILFADADLDAAVGTCVENAFLTSGQMCMANTRILVERSAYRQVHDAVCERVGALRTGPPDLDGVDFGPLISEQHLARVMGYVEHARERGRLAVGGRRSPLCEQLGGAYMEPTAIAGEGLPQRIVSEEIFGPVVTIEPFDGEEQALTRANASPYGLAGSVWTRDVERAWRLARAMQAGTVWVNRYNRMFAAIPSGGMKESGLGRTRGLDGVHAFTELKHINWSVGSGEPA